MERFISFCSSLQFILFSLYSRRLLQERTRNLEDMREMTASRASLSMLDVTRDMSEAGSMSGGGRMGMFKSYESLDVSSSCIGD